MKISFIGAGSWATALSTVVARNSHDVKIWGRNLKLIEDINKTRINKKYLDGIILDDNIEATNDIKYCLKDADIVVLAIASQANRKVLEANYKYFDKKSIIVNVSKGIENGSLLRISQVVAEFLDNDFVTLSGPSHAEELGAKLPTTLISASISKESAEIIQDVFSTEYLRIYTNPDIIGVELGGALKNIIALGAGISDGMGFGDNAKAALMTRGIREITKLGIELGAHVETFTGLSGVGDLIVTCTSMHSRNRRCGIMIGEGVSREEAQESIGMVVEGIYAVKAAYDLAIEHKIEMPIVNQLYSVLYDGNSAIEAVKNLMLRSKKHEMEEVTDKSVWN